MKKADLIIHPVRFRILQALSGELLTTQEIAARISDVPKSSLYRHLKILLDGELIEVAEIQVVKGIQEKTYRLAQSPYLNSSDMAGLTAEEHLTYFTTYIMTVFNGFAGYLEASRTYDDSPDLLADRVGYTEVALHASDAEIDSLQQELNASFLKLLRNKPGEGRRKRKFVIVTHPQEPLEENYERTS